jgi:hypothetical protein
MEFLHYMRSLPAEGEVFLVVKQKALQPLQYHPNGAVKSTFPAFINPKMKPGESWYGNTAAYLEERMTDRVAASARNCEFCVVLVLDDIGTKSKTPPLEPTWKMESSPGNYQWGYAFDVDNQPRKGEFAAAIKAIAAAGYTDPGAINPVRNFRLPGSVNLKNGFEAVLTEFHPERFFTLEQICAALNVTPGEPLNDGPQPTRLKDDGGDDVLRWLNEQGFIYTPPGYEGWYGVLCPNHLEHSDGNPEGRYLPASRAYMCFHGHCTHLDSAAFLAWVAEQGGPQHDPGLRDELVAGALSSALSRLDAPIEIQEDARRALKEVERREAGRLTINEWFDRFAYVQSDDSFYDLVERRELERNVFNATYRHVPCFSVHRTASGNLRRIEAATCFDENRVEKGAHTLAGVTFAAGESVLVARDGLVYGNRWRNARPLAVAGDITRWLAHAVRLIPDDAEREHVFNVMAYKVQNPHKKINHAIMHGGFPGSGKDTLWYPVFWAIGGDALQNVKQVRSDAVTGQWGYALESEVLVLQELRDTEAKDRRALENTLKNVIAAPPEFLTVNRKGLHPYEALNRVLVVAFSNDRMALTIPSNDRRWFVTWSNAERMPDEEGRAFWAWYEAGGASAVAAWLHARDVSNFNPGAAPPMTEAKAIMIETGLSGAEAFLTDLMRQRQGEFARGAVCGPWQGLLDRVAGMAPAGMRLPVHALLHAFREAGWVDMGRAHSADYPTKKHLFCAPDRAGMQKKDLLALAHETGARMAIVK